MATAVEVFSSISAGNKHVAVNLCFDADEVFIKDYLWRSRTLNGYFSEVINQSHEMIRLCKFHFNSNKYSDQWHTYDYIGPMRIKAINKLSNVSKKMEVSESKRVQFKLSHILFSFFLFRYNQLLCRALCWMCAVVRHPKPVNFSLY